MARITIVPESLCDHYPDTDTKGLDGLLAEADRWLEEATNALADTTMSEAARDDTASIVKMLRARKASIDSTMHYRKLPRVGADIVPCNTCVAADECSAYSRLCLCKTPAAVVDLLSGSKRDSTWNLDVVYAKRTDGNRLYIRLNEPYPPCFKRQPLRPRAVVPVSDRPMHDSSYLYRHRFDCKPETSEKLQLTSYGSGYQV